MFSLGFKLKLLCSQSVHNTSIHSTKGIFSFNKVLKQAAPLQFPEDGVATYRVKSVNLFDTTYLFLRKERKN